MKKAALFDMDGTLVDNTDAGLVVQKGAGHFAYLEHNQAFLRIAKNFLLEGRA